MIRVVTIASLVSLLMLVLYLPAVTDAAVYYARVRTELAEQGAAWGGGRSRAALADALGMLERPAAPPLMPVSGRGKGTPMTAGARQFESLGRRITDSAYVRSLNGLVLLAVFRLSTLAQLAPGFYLLAGACLTDGLVRRWVKCREFSRHHPEVWTACVCTAWLAVCAAVLSAVLPRDLPFALLPVLAGVACLCGGIAIANYPAGAGRGRALG